MAQTRIDKTSKISVKNPEKSISIVKDNDLQNEALCSVKKVEGFPKGDPEDILKLSDPPFYTAYPNPNIGEFIKNYGSPYLESTDSYKKLPFVGDISEGKGDPFYNLHTYHTKVPYKAINRFIEHYTNIDEVIFDGFSGTGMTGLSAQMLGRHCILVELSPAAAFISYNINTLFNRLEFRDEAQRVLDSIENECGWMFETWHPSDKSQNKAKGRINYVVWNDLFVCPYCGFEITLYDYSTTDGPKKDKCEHCNAVLTDRPERAKQAFFDDILGENIEKVKEIPVLINYSFGGRSRWKKPDKADLEIIQKINSMKIPYWFPVAKFPEGFNTEQPKRSHGIEYVHQMYSKRNLWVFAALWQKIAKAKVEERTRKELIFWAQALSVGQTYLNRYFEASYSQVNRFLKGTLYVASKRAEVSPWYSLEGKMGKIFKNPPPNSKTKCIISTQSTSNVLIPDSSIDYIFTDPPFGNNIMYSELNFIWEAWLKVFTNTKEEAIMNEQQKKDINEYRRLMSKCFQEMFRILKPNRWITVVFHNSKKEVWNAIQEGMAKAGFIVAQVATLDKQQMTMKQWAYPTSVKNDLVINAYKPKESFAKIFLEKSGYGLEMEFVRQHLERLPVDQNIERTEQMLYSKMLAYYLQHGYEINMDAGKFYSTLRNYFYERDTYWFLDNEVDLYEQKKKRKDLTSFQSTLFVSDELSAIQWLNGFLSELKEYNQIYSEFVKVLMTTTEKIPELTELLGENFVSVGGKYRRPQSLEKEAIEERRNKRLIKEFEGYLEKARIGKRLEDVRKEAILAGLIFYYQQKRYQDIQAIAKSLPQQLIANNSDIYDIIDVVSSKLSR